MNNRAQDEADKERLFNDLDEIKKQLTAVETKVTVMYKSFSGNGRPPLENRITRLETELKQIKDSADQIVASDVSYRDGRIIVRRVSGINVYETIIM